MDAPRDRPDWERYHALREQWVHEDDLVHYRMIWLILSQPAGHASPVAALGW